MTLREPWKSILAFAVGVALAVAGYAIVAGWWR